MQLLLSHCNKRGVSFDDSKKMKEAIEGDWNNHKEKKNIMFYYLTVIE